MNKKQKKLECLKAEIKTAKDKLYCLRAALEKAECMPDPYDIDICKMSDNNHRIKTDGIWAASVLNHEKEGNDTRGSDVAGHGAILYLTDCNGRWCDEEGNRVHGYLYFRKTG